MRHKNLRTFQQKIHEKGFVFAYPTEAVYGLGCNPFDESAVKRILAIKNRPSHQHFILIASDWQQINTLINLESIEKQQLTLIKATWPGPITWVFSASAEAPSWLVNTNNTIAIRITAHPIAKALCQIAQHPLISTSANLSGLPPCRTYQDTQKIFQHQVDLIIEGETGELLQPTPIRDAKTGEFLRF